MSRKVVMTFLFVLVLLTSALMHAPASLLNKHLPPMPKWLQLGSLSGSIWQGSVSQIALHSQQMGRLDWDINGFQLLLGKLDAAVNVSGITGISAKGDIGAGFGGLYANDLVVAAPAPAVNAFLPNTLPISFDGKFALNLTRYEAGLPVCSQANGNLKWQEASIKSPLGPIDLGQVVAKLSCDNGKLTVKGDSQSDAVQTEFTVSLAANQKITLAGWLLPKDGLSPTLKSQLSWLGKPDAQGRYPLSFNG